MINAYNTSKVEDLIDRDLLNMMSYIKKMKPPSDEEVKKKIVKFGELTRHKTLIWDMDETLVHAQEKIQGSAPYNNDFEITLRSGHQYVVTVRPYMKEVLTNLASFYEMAIFTAADQEYADLILDQLDPEKEFFSHRLYR